MGLCLLGIKDLCGCLPSNGLPAKKNSFLKHTDHVETVLINVFYLICTTD